MEVVSKRFYRPLPEAPHPTASGEESCPDAGSFPEPDQFGKELVPCSTSLHGFILETAVHENCFNLLCQTLQLDS